MVASLANWVLVILPKLPFPPSNLLFWRLASGILNCGVFARLNVSARNCSFQRSVNGMSLNRDRSRVRVGGPVWLWRPRLPPVREAAVVTEVMSNHWAGSRPLAGASFGLLPAMASGRHAPQTPWQPFQRSV